MPANLEWVNPQKTILLGTARGEIANEEFMRLFDQEVAMITSVDHPVDVVIDFREMTRVPMDILGLSAAFGRQKPVNMRSIILVGSNPVLRTMVGIWSKITINIAMVRSPEEAFTWISENIR